MKFDPVAALRQEHSRAQTDRIAAWVLADVRRYGKMIDLMTGSDRLLAQRSAWVVGVVGEARPDWVVPQLARLLDHLTRPGLHPAVVRAVFRLLQVVPIPGTLEGRVMGLAFAALGGPAAVAVKAYSLTILKRLAAGNHELIAEVRAVLAEELPGAAPAVWARARREFGIGGRGWKAGGEL
jgi:hypothetical protein